MPRFKLVPYSVRVIDSEGNYTKLNDISGNDLLDILVNYLDHTSQNPYVFNESKETFIVEDYIMDSQKRVVWGRVRCGDYGYEADFLNVKTKKIKTKARRMHDSELIPFFFYFYIPKDKEIGYLILQTFKNLGVKTVLQISINYYIFKQGIPAKIEFRPLISQDIIKELESKRILRIRFIKKGISKDVADRYYIESDGEDIKEEIIFIAKKNKDLKIRFKELFKNVVENKTSKGYYEIANEKFDEIKIEIDDGGSKRTISISDYYKLRECMPLPEKIRLVGGFPTMEYLVNKAEEYLKHIIEKSIIDLP